MTLQKPLKRYFDAPLRARGEECVKEASLVEADAKHLVARFKARSGEPYTTRLDIEAGQLIAACTCPFHAAVAFCRHTWALVLLADQQKHLVEAASLAQPLALTKRREARESTAGAASDTASHLERTKSQAPAQGAARTTGWQARVSLLKSAAPALERALVVGAEQELVYVLDAKISGPTTGLVLETALRTKRKDGIWGVPAPCVVTVTDLVGAPTAADRNALGLLLESRASYGEAQAPRSRFVLGDTTARALVPELAATQRLYVHGLRGLDEYLPVAWDGDATWTLTLHTRSDGDYVEATGRLVQKKKELAATELALAVPGGLAFTKSARCLVVAGAPTRWLEVLKEGPLLVPVSERAQLVEALALAPVEVKLEGPSELEPKRISVQPTCRLHVRTERAWNETQLVAELAFDYAGHVVDWRNDTGVLYDRASESAILRAPATEQAALALVLELGAHAQKGAQGARASLLSLPPERFVRLASQLVTRGWHVEADKVTYRAPKQVAFSVSSRSNWLDVNGTAEFHGESIPLPRLLEAVKKHQGTVRLGDGSVGLLPEEWLHKLGWLASLGTADDHGLHLPRSQAGLVDALFATSAEVKADADYGALRKTLAAFEGIKARSPRSTFVGELRPYQQQGLGWLCWLKDAGLGGCLADDMGLGKTVQVLALLAEVQHERAKLGTTKKGAAAARGNEARPSLLVAPRSLIYNWSREAARFVPGLRVLDFSRADRTAAATPAALGEYDLVLATYGTLRRDIEALAKVPFEYAILDEAQAVKNASSATAKAVRLLDARHRLAMTGTPIENHLGELTSLFDFVNPGMLTPGLLERVGLGKGEPDPDGRALLGRVLTPFILRRTKDQVAKDLPKKLEQVLTCELGPEQQALYDELRTYYQKRVKESFDPEAPGKSSMQVLEALLRLRQAACHPGLVDAARATEASAKLELLVPMLQELVREEHKALVFSQFTSFLDIVERRLKDEGIRPLRLDGSTRDRASLVERFQEDPHARVFLISLKAGGVGLNLTAADYVFLLDPWWNPAAEAQAIDRSHRIGQTRRVIAYRMVARGTIEEKVLELQAKKRELVAEVLEASEQGPVASLSREDLNLLLG